VDGGDRGPAVVDEVRDEVERAHLVVDVQARGRFVQQEHGRGLRERSREHDALALPATDRRDGFVREPRDLGAFHRAVDGVVILAARAVEAPAVRGSTHRDHVPDAEVEREVGVLGHHRDAATGLARPQASDRVPVDGHDPVVGREHARESSQERRLPGAVRADEADELALVHRYRHRVQDPRPAERDVDVLHADHGRITTVRASFVEGALIVRAPRGDGAGTGRTVRRRRR